MRNASFALLAALLVAVVSAGSAQACSCPKEYLIKKYGTISQIPPQPAPAPTQPPAQPAAPVTGS